MAGAASELDLDSLFVGAPFDSCRPPPGASQLQLQPTLQVGVGATAVT